MDSSDEIFQPQLSKVFGGTSSPRHRAKLLVRSPGRRLRLPKLEALARSEILPFRLDDVKLPDGAQRQARAS